MRYENMTDSELIRLGENSSLPLAQALAERLDMRHAPNGVFWDVREGVNTASVCRDDPTPASLLAWIEALVRFVRIGVLMEWPIAEAWEEYHRHENCKRYGVKSTLDFQGVIERN